MKKIYLIMAAIASVALVSCSNEEFVGELNPATAQGAEAISFSTTANTITRADHFGADAASLLGEKFYVGSYKTTSTATSTVFDNYVIQWGANTAETTTDNTSDWKYVGLTAPGLGDVSGSQTIKYWDFSANYYNFVAYALGGNDIITTGTPTANQILATVIDPDNLTTAAYTLTGSAEDLKECYMADMITAKKSGTSSPDMDYNNAVTFNFRCLGSKIRIALYETIPGYSVRDVKFYTENTTTIATGASATDATLFASSNVFPTSGTMTVYYPKIGDTNRSDNDYNKAFTTFAAASGDTPTSTLAFNTLNYEDPSEDARLAYSGNTNKYLKRTSADPSFAGTTAPYFVTVLPNATGNVLELRVDYTLESIDGSKETITIHGATAYVPQIYAIWKPNVAYTYIFKISDNTNGWTSTVTTDPAGLYPITFDAVAVDAEEIAQSTITTVATPSITTYQKGHDISKNEYAASTENAIYVQVMSDGSLATDLASKGQLYTIADRTGKTITEADVMDALNMQESVSGNAITGRNGWVLTTATSATDITAIPGADGKDITVTAGTAASFAAAAGTYAYVYTVSTGTPSEYYTNVTVTTGTNVGDGSYYTLNNGTYTVYPSGTTAETGTYYYKKYTNNNNVYGVKVIRVV